MTIQLVNGDLLEASEDILGTSGELSGSDGVGDCEDPAGPLSELIS